MTMHKGIYYYTLYSNFEKTVFQNLAILQNFATLTYTNFITMKNMLYAYYFHIYITASSIFLFLLLNLRFALQQFFLASFEAEMVAY